MAKVGVMRTLPPPPTLKGVDRRLTQYLQEFVSKFNSLSTEVRDIAIATPAMPTTPSSPEELPENPSPSTPTNPSTPTTGGGSGTGGTGGTGGGSGGEGSQVLPVLPNSDTLLSSRSLISGGGNIEGALGMAARPQLPYAPRVTQLPPRGDPQSQNGSLVIFQDFLYQFTGGIDTGTWSLISPPPIPTTLFRSIDITSITVNANTTTTQILMTKTIPANTFSPTNSGLRVSAYGDLDVVAGPVTVTISLRYAGQQFLTWVFVPNAAGAATILEWGFVANLLTGIDASFGPEDRFSNGGILICNDGAVPIIGVSQAQRTVFLQLGIDITIAQLMEVTIAFSSASVSNVGRQRSLIIEQF